ncbi:MAG: acylphosphatase [Candidatus Omnitrophota bacterium]|jgi:acylphosphatase
MKKRIHVFFSGTVQGVGFRFTTEDIGRDIELSGWIKNLKDGRVEIVAEGDEEILKQFLNEIHERFSRYITDTNIQWEDSTNEFESFEIVFDM